jgi:hypothetical protein
VLVPSHRKTVAVLIALALGAIAMIAVRAQRAQDQRIKALERELRTMAGRQQRGGEVSSPATGFGAWTNEKTPVLPAIVGPAPSASPAPSAANEAPPATAEAGMPDDEYAASVAAAFTVEPRDATWASGAERAISESLRSIGDDGLLENLECRENLCKASLRHRDASGFSEFLDRMMARANETWTGEIFSYREPGDDNGVVDNTLYFAKPGQSIHALALPR